MLEVSIVIPSFNGRKLLEKYLPFIVKEVKDRGEIIVVNDCSTDGTAEFIRKIYPFIKLIELTNNMGFAYASNRGIVESKYRFVCLLNTDVEVTPGFLEPLLRHFEKEDIFAVSSTELTLSDSKPTYAIPSVQFKFGIFWYKYHPVSEPLKEAVPVLFVPGSCVLYDKEKFLSLGGFDVLFKPIYWEDMDICFRAWKKGWQSLYEPKSAHYHYRQATISHKYLPLRIKIFHWKNRFLFVWKNIKSPSLLIQHFLFLIPEIFLLPILNKVEFTLGFFCALKYLSDIFKRKLEPWENEIFSDKEIIRKFNIK